MEAIAPSLPSGVAWPRPEEIDPSLVRLHYDRDSDTLVGFFDGAIRSAYADQVGDQVFALIDPKTEEVVGFQVEAVLSEVIHQLPALLDYLDHAELHGISTDELRRFRTTNGVERTRNDLVALIADLEALSEPGH